MPGGTSGKNGNLYVGSSSLIEVTNIKFKRSVNESAYASNQTGGWKTRVAGTKDATGSFEGKYHADDPIENKLDVGDSVSLEIFWTSTLSRIVPILVLSIDYEINIDSGEVETFTVEFGTRGAVPALS